MKKIVSILIVLAVLVAPVALFAGGQQATAARGASITVQVEDGWLDYYEATVARVLEQYPNASIRLIESGSFDMLDVLDGTDAGNPDVADVFAFPADRIYGLVNNDVLAPIDGPAMAARVGGFDDYEAGLGGAFKVDGEYFGFPMNIETLINFVNTENAAAAGIDTDSTIELTDLAYDAMLVPVFNAWFGVALTNSAGIEFLEMDGQGGFYSDLTADWADLAPEKQDAFRALYEYWAAHEAAGTPLWDASSAWGYMDAEFEPGGATAIRLEGPWSTGALTDRAGADNIKILPMNQVTLNGNPLLHWKGGWAMGINARTEGDAAKTELAVAFIEELINPAFAIDFFKSTGKIMENVPASVYLNSDLGATDKTVVAAVVESYQDAPARPLFTEWGQVWGTWENSMLSWASVRPGSVEAAYAEVQAGFKALLGNL
ncbi:sugar ABC transporter substrate-binding protein [Spirochaeta dissipatitropha]